MNSTQNQLIIAYSKRAKCKGEGVNECYKWLIIKF